MKRDLSGFRKNYQKGQLLEDFIPQDPFVQFSIWFEEAEAASVEEPNAMILTTMGLNGFPQSRVVLLKEMDYRGFVFFSQYTSQKGNSIAENPRVSLLFFWSGQERQVRIEGMAYLIDSQKSDLYFSKRPYDSQIAAWVSPQSQSISGRQVLEERVHSFEKKFKPGSVPRPSNWGGYRVSPLRMEFWQGRPNRLHDRILFSKESNGWQMERLAP